MSWSLVLSSGHRAFLSFIDYIPLWWLKRLYLLGTLAIFRFDLMDKWNDTGKKWMNEWWMNEWLLPFHGWGTLWEASRGQVTGRKPHTDVVALPDQMPHLFSLLSSFIYQLSFLSLHKISALKSKGGKNRPHKN